MASRRKKNIATASSGNKRSRKSLDLAARGFDKEDDELIESSDDDDQRDNTPSFQEESESEEENLDVKKVRLAREYLEKIDAADDSSSDEDGASDDDDDEHDTVSRKLQRDRLKRDGTLERDYAEKVEESVVVLQKKIVEARPAILSPEASAAFWVDAGYVSLLSGHDLTPTCVALTGDGCKAISGSKDHSVLLWDIETQKKLATLCDHWKRKPGCDRTAGQVLSVACSDDGKYVAVGKRDAMVSIYDIRGGEKSGLIKTFAGHKGAITSLTFRSQSHQLFSASEDRCIRHYNLDEMLYLETLYGHQFGVTGIDCYRRERPVSVARDRTARAWKLAEDAHLIFRGGSRVQSADCVTCVKDDWFVTGHEDGVVSLWMTEKKRAVTSVEHSHGVNKHSGLGRGVVSISSIKGSDVVATGSSDGYLRFWKVRTGRTVKERGIEAISQIPVHGFINAIACDRKAKFCVAAIGQEHRCGRWERVSRAKNRLAIIKLQAPDDIASPNLDFEALD